ncbi:MAG: putative sugar O-methyltransferase [Oscillochloris sp.]|nr:putative sugar O-methyltransferase [Oscillochloris sp.]
MRDLAILLTMPFSKTLSPPTSQEIVLIDELRTSFQAFPYTKAGGANPSESAWINHMNRLRDLVLSEDPRRFLCWDVIRATMFIDYARYIRKELRHLQENPGWSSRWRPAIKESSIGSPTRYLYWPDSSANLIHHAYHLVHFEEVAGSRVENIDYILEIGGGYGSLCRLFHNLSFQGKYVIFDLPHFSALQSFFLRSLGIPVHSFESFKTAKSGVICISEIGLLQSLLAQASTDTKSMFIATWSLSETPLYFRDSLLPLVVNARFSAFLIAYQHVFEEVDNIGYFRCWREDVDRQIQWDNRHIEHLPGNSYLVGKREFPPVAASNGSLVR